MGHLVTREEGSFLFLILLAIPQDTKAAIGLPGTMLFWMSIIGVYLLLKLRDSKGEDEDA